MVQACPDFGEQAAAHIEADRDFPASRVAAGYWPVRSEADCIPVLAKLRAQGRTIVLPCVEGDYPLSFREWFPGAPLEAAGLGLKEPLKDAPTYEPDLLFLPLLAFDGDGHRLGYGGGHYDRTLEALRARMSITAIGIAFTAQCIERIPSEGHDELLDGVLTETGLHWFAHGQ